ncbi:MAG: hypothetical protein DRI90_08095 [Deltaproteobacteria bacterium]|nr:MAG: hypothetical protein DRI90_08095 [Deltaproteobacteria bacterium]
MPGCDASGCRPGYAEAMSFLNGAWSSLALSMGLLACNGAAPKPTIAGEKASAARGQAPPTVTVIAQTQLAASARATAAPTTMPSDGESLVAADAGGAPQHCGYAPPARSDKAGFGAPSNAGCGLAPASTEPHKTVVSIDVVSLTLGPRHTIVEVVFLDAIKRRVLPIGRKLSFDMRFKHHQRGELRLNEDMHRDGVFELELRSNDRAKPCQSHLFLRLHNGKELIEEWVDDWLYGC